MTTVDATGDASRTEPAWRLPAELYALRPEAARLLDHVNEGAWGTAEPALLELIRLRVGRLIGTDDGTPSPAQVTRGRSLGLPEEKVSNLTSYSTSAEFSSADRECIAFAEQFAMDVSGVTPGMRDALAAQVGQDDLHDFVTAVFVLEFTQRMQTMSRRLLPSAPPVTARSPGHESDGDLPLQPALLQFQDAVVRGKALDLVTTELVRLRCARTHQ
jgi:alkylhydroperoxidase family enzyme